MPGPTDPSGLVPWARSPGTPRRDCRCPAAMIGAVTVQLPTAPGGSVVPALPAAPSLPARAGQTVGGAVPGAIRPQREARMGAMPDTTQPAPFPSVYQLRVVVRGVSPLI